MSFRPKPLLGQRINTAHPLAKGLVGCWVMNEGGGGTVYDLSRSKVGTISATGTWATTVEGRAVYFSSGNNGEISFGTSPISGEGAFTLITRCYFDSGSRDHGLFQSWDNSTNQVLVRTDVNAVQFYLQTGAQTGGNVGLDISIGAWQTFVFVYDGAQMRAYKDNIIGSTTYAKTGTVTNPSEPLKLGGGSASATEKYTVGKFLYAHAYNKALTLSEIQALDINPYAIFEDPYPIELFGYVAAVGELSIDENDSVSVLENINAALNNLLINKSDLVGITEDIITEVIGVVLEQEGFRWRDDDDSEAAATWLAAQDVDVSKIREVNIRLRFLINASNNPDSKQFKLQYKKTSDSTWRDMPESL